VKVSNQEIIGYLMDEFLQFPELAQRYMANLFFTLALLCRRTDYMENAAIVVGTFEREKYFQKALGDMDKKKAHDLYFSITNTVCCFNIFTDEELEKVKEFFLSVNKNNVRSKLKNKGIISEFITKIEKNFLSPNFWSFVTLRSKTKETEIFILECDDADILQMLKDIVGEDFKDEWLNSFLPRSCSFFYHNEEQWTKGIIISNTTREGIVISVIEQ